MSDWNGVPQKDGWHWLNRQRDGAIGEYYRARKPWLAQMLDMLHVAELIDVADRHQIACGKRPNHTTLVAELVDLLQGREVIAAVCRALRERGAFWEGTDAPIVGEPSAVPHPTKQEAML